MPRRIDALTVYGVAFLIFLYAPVLLLPMFSFNDNTFAVFPLVGFTTSAYVELANNDSLLNALRNSLIVGSLRRRSSAPSSVCSPPWPPRAIGMPGRGPVMGVIMLPLVVPSIILAVALLIVLRKVFDIPLTLWTVGAGHILLCVPFSMLVLMSRLEGFDKSLEEAANDLGENGWMTFWRVTFPLALPGIVSSLLMAFTVSFDEYVIAFFLSGIDQTLPIFLWSQLRFPDRLPMTEALGSCILFASTIIVVASELLRRRGVKSIRPTGL